MATLAQTLRATDPTRTVARKKKRKGFTPFVAPIHPPPGTYDPTLDAAVRASTRGLQDYQADYNRDYGRREDDYLLARGDIRQQHDRSLSDVLRGYANLRSHQTMAGNAAGLLGAGTGPIGGGYMQLARQRRTTNRLRDTGRLEQDTSRSYSRLGLGYQRSNEDASTLLSRAVREAEAFKTDTSAAEFYQAAGTGYEPPSRPKWEKVMGTQHYKPLGGGRYMLPSGRIVTLAQLKRRSAKKSQTAFVTPGVHSGYTVGP